MLFYLGSAASSLASLAQAARDADGTAILQKTDMKALRHSLTDQIVRVYLERIGAIRRISGQYLWRDSCGCDGGENAFQTRGNAIHKAQYYRVTTYFEMARNNVCQVAIAEAPGQPRCEFTVCRRPEELMHVVELLEQELGRKAVKEMLPMQPGDVMETFADVGDLMRDTGFRPQTSIEDGIRDFVAWYRDHYKV
jgi:hypothetical protein